MVTRGTHPSLRAIDSLPLWNITKDKLLASLTSSSSSLIFYCFLTSAIWKRLAYGNYAATSVTKLRLLLTLYEMSNRSRSRNRMNCCLAVLTCYARCGACFRLKVVGVSVQYENPLFSDFYVLRYAVDG